MKLKTKLSLAIGFLFFTILLLGLLGLVSNNQLKTDAKNVLKNNYESLVYCNAMLKALDKQETDSSLQLFQKNLDAQKANITEPGEKNLTDELNKNYSYFRQHPDSSLLPAIRKNIQSITDINQEAIQKKSQSLMNTASDFNQLFSVVFTIFAIISLTLSVNFPGMISNPIRSLTEGISSIAQKNYKKRIYVDRKDEFGDLANAFNSMAEKLDEYEHSNLNKLMFEKKRIETIINKMKDGIIGLDDKGNILFLNEFAQQLLRLKEMEVVGINASDIALKNDLLRTLLDGPNPQKQLKIYTDNKQSYFDKDIIEVKSNQEIIGQVIILKNITGFYELNEAKTNFIATVSHELKTPIAAIKMSLQLLENEETGNMNEEQKQLVESIQDDSERLLRITAELLNLAQVETGNIQLNIHNSNPYEILNYALEAVKLQIDQKKIRLIINKEEHLPDVKADPDKTAWVLINFLTNAIRYSPEQSELIIGMTKEESAILFYVKDKGSGIDPKYQNKIFDRYFQVPGGSKSGTGLGLAICKEFIEAQGGNIFVESEIGEGSRFSFSLNT